MRRKMIVVIIAALLLADIMGAAQRVQHQVKVTQVNDHQAIVACRDGRTPAVDTKAVEGIIIVSCGGQEQ